MKVKIAHREHFEFFLSWQKWASVLHTLLNIELLLKSTVSAVDPGGPGNIRSVGVVRYSSTHSCNSVHKRQRNKQKHLNSPREEMNI